MKKELFIINSNIFTSYAENLGRVLANLLSLELLARTYLAKKEGSEHFPDKTAKIGDFIEKNSLTNYDSLRQILKEYNKNVSNEKNVIIGHIITIRNAIAHGRVLTENLDEPLTLYKFSKPKNGGDKVCIDTIIKMDKDWFNTSIKLIRQEIKKICSAMDF